MRMGSSSKLRKEVRFQYKKDMDIFSLPHNPEGWRTKETQRQSDNGYGGSGDLSRGYAGYGTGDKSPHSAGTQREHPAN